MVLAPGEHLDVRPLSLFRPSGHGRQRNDLAASGERNLSDRDVMAVRGLAVTTPIRTAWDLGRVRWTDEAISGIDAMFRLRATGPLADARSESPGESVLRLRCIEANVPVVPQVEVWQLGDLLGRIDLANEELMLGIEYDGVEWHTSPDQREHDRARRRDLTEAGWLMRALQCEDVFGRARECDRIIREAAREARASRGARTA